MIEQIVDLCLRRRRSVWIIAIFIAMAGAFGWSQLRVEAYPDISDVTVQVTTQAIGLSAEDVEQQITTPLERSLAATPGLLNIRSSSTFGLSLITLIFRDGVEPYFARQRTLERIGQANVPSAYQPALGPLTGPIDEIYRFTLDSDNVNLMELSELMRWRIVPALQRVPGVANIDIFGGYTMQYTLEVDPDALKRYNLGLSDVISAINNNSANAGGSSIPRGEQSYVIRGIGLARSLEDIGAMTVTQRNGTPILLRELGALSYSHQERGGVLGRNANPDAVQGNVQMLKGENASEVLARVKARVDELNNDLKIKNVRINPYISRDVLINSTIEKVGHTVLEGITLVFIVLIFFLGSPRAALIVSTTIPMALASAFIIMNLTHLPANLLSLGAIDFGVIVDGAVVIVELILRQREEAPEKPLYENEIAHIAASVARPIFFATVIIIMAYLPLLGLQRTEAKLFSPIAYTISYALVGALFSSLLLAPGLAFVAFRKPSKPFVNPIMEWMSHHYQRMLDTLLGHKTLAWFIAGSVLSSVVLLGATIGGEFLPELDEGSLWLQVQLPSGISIEKASSMADELRHVIAEYPEVQDVISQLGRSDSRTDPWTPSHIEMPVTLKPYDSWPDQESKREFVRKLQARALTLPGYQIGFSQPIIDNVNDLVGGAHSALVLRVIGPDLTLDRRIGEQIVEVLKQVQGTTEASIFQENPTPQISITAKRSEAARYGINISDIANVISIGIGGEAVNQIYVSDRVYSITARYPLNYRNGIEAIGALTLPSSTGAQIPLSLLADIRYVTAEGTISHNEVARNITVRIDYANRDLSSWLDEAQKRLAKDVQFDPEKIHLEWAGQFENQRRAQTRLSVIMGIVIGLMLLMLCAGFRNFRQAMLILCIAPMAMLGGLAALHGRNEPLNVASAVGFIALFGVAVQNGIIMVAGLNRMREHKDTLKEAVLKGAGERLRPVMMTSIVATVGMLPAAMATGVGSDVQRALATVVVGGLLASTFLTMFILPFFYYYTENMALNVAQRRGNVPKETPQ